MKKKILVVLSIWAWCMWIYKNQSWVVTPAEAKLMWETGAKNLRVINFGLIASAISLFYLKTKSISATLVLATSPWWFRFGAPDRQTALIIFFSMLAFKYISKNIWLFTTLLIVSMWPIYKSNSWFWKAENLSIKNSQVQTVIRFEQETQINNGNEILPVKFKKLAYNKFFYPIRRTSLKLAEVLDWENISSPSQKNVTVGNNPYTKKGIAMIPPVVLLLAIIGFSNLNPWLGLTALISGFFGRSDDVLINSILLAPALAMGATYVLEKLPKLLMLLTIIFFTLSVRDLWYHFVFQEVRWNDNKNRTMDLMADTAKKVSGNLIVTEMLGPTRYYYYYKYGIDERITFSHFDLKNEKRVNDSVYIGLPGEFVENRSGFGRNDFRENEAKQGIKIVEKIPLVDTVSFGNGNEIWIGK